MPHQTSGVTTTRASLHQENETRMLSLETDDSQVQTEAVMEKIAEIEGEGSVESINYAKWHDYQRWLAAGERRVIIPWARPLRKLIRASAVRLRRDFGQFLRAIKAHALLHRFHGEKDAKGRIVATIDAVDDGEACAAKVQGDYEAVADLFADRGKRELGLPEQTCGEAHAPLGEVGERRLADQ